MNNTRSADYGGGTIRPVEQHVLDLIVAETCSHSALMQMVNPNFTLQTLGLDKARKATYDILTDIEVGGFTGSNLNGEVWEPDNPFKSGEVTLCQTLKIEKKFSRQEAIFLGSERWGVTKNGYETSVGAAISRDLEYYGLRTILAHADRFNVGNTAGKNQQTIKLGDSANPVVVGGAGISPSALIRRMRLAIVENAGNCGRLGVIASHNFYDLILDEQSKMGHCDMFSNPLITGLTSPLLNTNIFATVNAPYIANGPTGKRVEYVIMGNPDHIAAPMDMQYFEWQTILHDEVMVGNFVFDVAALSGKSIAVAAIVIDE